jgi:hypothetical protein
MQPLFHFSNVYDYLLKYGNRNSTVKFIYNTFVSLASPIVYVGLQQREIVQKVKQLKKKRRKCGVLR